MRFPLVDRTCEVEWGDAEVRDKPVRRIVLHRFGGDEAWWNEYAPGKDAPAISRAFRSGKLGPLRRMPYGFVVHDSGAVEQALPLHVWNYHARMWSIDSFAVAVLGDFRKHEPTELQWDSLIHLCVGLTLEGQLTGGTVGISGHTDLADATKIEDHDCPGKHLDRTKLKHEVNERVGTFKRTLMGTWGFTH